MKTRKRVDCIVLAYSGNVHTTVAIPWLAEHYRTEIVTVTLDLGQPEGLESTRDRALAAGAARAHVVDARDEFARDFVVPALRAGALTPNGDFLSAALNRPIIAKHVVDVARLEDATSIAHGCDADHVRCFESLVRGLDRSLTILAPVCEWKFSPADLLSYARARRLSLAGISTAARSVSSAPDCPADMEVSFEEGVPVAINGVSLSLVDLISSAGTIAGAHGVGAVSPAAAVLHDAHRALQAFVTAPEIDRRAREQGADYAELVTSGGWYSTSRRDSDAFVASIQKHVTGTARLRLFKGRSEVVECRSPFAVSAIDPRRTDNVAVRS